MIVIEQDVDQAFALVDYAIEHGLFALSGPPKTIAADPWLRQIYVGAAD